MSNRIMHLFFDTDMRGRHEALAERAKQERKFNISTAKPGDLLVFINRSRDRVMVLAGTGEEDGFGVLAYYRSPHGRIDMNAIQYIPQALSGGELKMDRATCKALKVKLERKRKVAVPDA